MDGARPLTSRAHGDPMPARAALGWLAAFTVLSAISGDGKALRCRSNDSSANGWSLMPVIAATRATTGRRACDLVEPPKARRKRSPRFRSPASVSHNHSTRAVIFAFDVAKMENENVSCIPFQTVIGWNPQVDLACFTMEDFVGTIRALTSSCQRRLFSPVLNQPPRSAGGQRT
jgi:hypothetical protein